MTPRKSPFKIIAQEPHRPKDPESLFGDLHPSDANVKHLWAHQADVLRAYAKEHEKTANVALELPTGMGKTLVGLVLAEYRRRKFDERILYLCPTRQLAHQVGWQATSYGIDAVVLVGPQASYPAQDYAKYARGTSVAITTYSGLFNVNPRLHDAQAILLDDAHAGGEYMAQHWSMEVPRDHEAYKGVVSLFDAVVPRALLVRFQQQGLDPVQRRDVFKIPSYAFFSRIHALIDYLDATIPPNSKQSYPWSVVREHLQATHLYISWYGLTVRPIIPPTLRHPPFANAHQRIYMSATLGAGGELERLIGVDRIARIPVPENWESQRVGRRFILIPDLSLSRTESNKFFAEAIGKRDRSLVLCPTNTQAQEVATYLKDSAGVQTMDASAIEESLEPFAKTEHCALVLATRYDGIDLPDESCRQLVLFGLPAALNLQERFFVDRLRADVVLKDRIRTRITQAIGRCTRNPRDYAAILLFGTDLMEFCLRRENTVEMPCELQAEMRFGIDNSEGASHKKLMDLLDVFFKQEKDWKEADAAIRDLRDKCTQEPDSSADNLMKVAPQEVQYTYALWDGDVERALLLARQISDALGGPQFANYRGWWLYLASSTAFFVSKGPGDEGHRLANELLERAKGASASWIRSIYFETGPSGGNLSDDLLIAAGENVATALRDAGFFGAQFERLAARFLDEIHSDDPPTFERAVEHLGRLLGFESFRPEGVALPDVLWQLADRVHVVLEAKSQVGTREPISVATARQCVGHGGTGRDLLKLGKQDACEVVLLCHNPTIVREAIPQVGSTSVFLIDKLRQLAGEVVNTLRRIRALSDGGPQLVEIIANEYARARLDPIRVLGEMTNLKATKLKAI